MRRFYIDEIKTNDKVCVITGSEARHITKVLRMKPGDGFILIDSKGTHFKAVIESTTPREVVAGLKYPLPGPPSSPVRITLCQAISKSQAMDYLIQKTSELGIDSIAPFYSDRTIVRLEKDRLANKMRHWREIAISSAKQCGRGLPAKIYPPTSFKDLITKWRGESALKVVLWEDELKNDLKSLLKCSSANNFVGIVGPEGGFAREEIKTAGEAGFIPVSMGNRILRAETSAVTMVAIVQYELGDLSLPVNRLTNTT